MSNRAWFFRLSYITGVALAKTVLSLSLLINPLSTHAADGGITVWVIRQSVQLIATGLGLGAVACNELLKSKGNGHAPYGISHTARIDTTTKARSMKIDTANQGGQGTSTKKPSKSQSNEQYEEYMLREWQKQATQYDDKKLNDIIGLAEGNLNSAKADRYYYKEGTKARAELEDAINFEEQSLSQLKEIRESRKQQKEQLAKQATTISASAVVLTTQTAPVSAPQALEPSPIPGENLWKMQVKAGDPLRKEALGVLERRGKDAKEKRAQEKEAQQEELNKFAGKPPHEDEDDEEGKNLQFRDERFKKPDQHNWNKKEGHFRRDTPTARDLIRKAIKDGNYRGIKDGKHQYDWVNPETGEQIYAATRGNNIESHGINVKPWGIGADGFLEEPLGYVRDINGAVIRGITGTVLGSTISDTNAEDNPIKGVEVKKDEKPYPFLHQVETPIEKLLKKPDTMSQDIKPILKPEIIDNIAKQHAEVVKREAIEKITAPKDYADKYQWWPFTNDHLPSNFPEAPEVWASPSKIARYEKAIENYKSSGGFAGNYKKGYDYGNTDHIWKKGDPTPDWAKPAWARNNKD